MTVPPQSTRAKVRSDFIRFARAQHRSYTVNWTSLKLDEEETILCMDPFTACHRRVDDTVCTGTDGPSIPITTNFPHLSR